MKLLLDKILDEQIIFGGLLMTRRVALEVLLKENGGEYSPMIDYAVFSRNRFMSTKGNNRGAIETIEQYYSMLGEENDGTKLSDE